MTDRNFFLCLLMDSCIVLVQFVVPAAELMQIGPPPLAVIAKERRAAVALKLKFFLFQAT
jgi:hypothetical protein